MAYVFEIGFETLVTVYEMEFIFLDYILSLAVWPRFHFQNTFDPDGSLPLKRMSVTVQSCALYMLIGCIRGPPDAKTQKYDRQLR